MEYGVKGLSKSYGELKVLDDITLRFEVGKVTCLLGPSGCGKTTLLNILTGAIEGDEGEVIGFKGERLSYIFQEDRLIEWKTVKENLEFVLGNDINKNDREVVIKEFLKAVGMENYINYYPNKLSGGMRQRVGIIRAFLYPSEVLIMDEPFKSMDADTKNSVMECFMKLMERRRRTVILVTHDIEEARELSDTIVTLSAKPCVILDTLHI